MSRGDQDIPGVGYLCYSPLNLQSVRVIQGKQPLIILFTWLGASNKAIRNYVNLYTDKGVDCLVIPGNLSYFLRPLIGMEVAKRILNYLIYEQDKYDKYFVHAFSVGAFMLTLCAVLVRDDTNQFGQFQSRLHASILDSVTVGSLETMAKGIAKSASAHTCIRLIYFTTVMVFFKLSPGTVRIYNDLIAYISSAPFDVPSLFYCCQNDSMCNFTELDKVTRNWRQKLSSDVILRSWEKSVHAAHLIVHKKEYLHAFNEFCERIPNFFPADIKILSKL